MKRGDLHGNLREMPQNVTLEAYDQVWCSDEVIGNTNLGSDSFQLTNRKKKGGGRR